jgi:hypothetical protein
MKLKAAMMTIGLALMFIQPAAAQTVEPFGESVIRTKTCYRVSDWVLGAPPNQAGVPRSSYCFGSCLPGELGIMSWRYTLNRYTNALSVTADPPLYFRPPPASSPGFPINVWFHNIHIAEQSRIYIAAKIQIACIAPSG